MQVFRADRSSKSDQELDITEISNAVSRQAILVPARPEPTTALFQVTGQRIGPIFVKIHLTFHTFVGDTMI